MASHAPTRIRPRAVPLSAVLATIPSLPRPVLARLTAAMIDRLDDMDGDADDEQEEDRCSAGDDDVRGGFSPGQGWTQRVGSGDDENSEPQHASAFDRDQTPRPAPRYDQARRKAKATNVVGLSNVGPLVPIAYA